MALTIGELARAAEIPASTVRYYERIGLLKPDGRSRANYRLYSSEAVEQVRFIRAARATGFSLDDIAKLLHDAPCPDVQRLIETRLADVAERLRDLRHVQRVLKSALDECRRAHSKECPVVAKLHRS